MSLVNGFTSDLVIQEILPKLRLPMDSCRKCSSDRVEILGVLSRLRQCWSASKIWKSSIERTLEWSAWRLARWETKIFRRLSILPGMNFHICRLPLVVMLWGHWKFSFNNTVILYSKVQRIQSSPQYVLAGIGRSGQLYLQLQYLLPIPRSLDTLWAMSKTYLAGSRVSVLNTFDQWARVCS